MRGGGGGSAASRSARPASSLAGLDGLGQPRGGQLAPSLRQFLVGAAAEGGDLGIPCRDPLPQRIVGGQPGGQPLGRAQPARGELLLHLLARGLGVPPANMAAAISPASSSTRPSSRACPAMARWTKPRPANCRSHSMTSDSSSGVELTGRARGAAQDGQDVLGGPLPGSE